jgi:hypothetical protein
MKVTVVLELRTVIRWVLALLLVYFIAEPHPPVYFFYRHFDHLGQMLPRQQPGNPGLDRCRVGAPRTRRQRSLQCRQFRQSLRQGRSKPPQLPDPQALALDDYDQLLLTEDFLLAAVGQDFAAIG